MIVKIKCPITNALVIHIFINKKDCQDLNRNIFDLIYERKKLNEELSNFGNYNNSFSRLILCPNCAQHNTINNSKCLKCETRLKKKCKKCNIETSLDAFNRFVCQKCFKNLDNEDEDNNNLKYINNKQTNQLNKMNVKESNNTKTIRCKRCNHENKPDKERPYCKICYCDFDSENKLNSNYDVSKLEKDVICIFCEKKEGNPNCNYCKSKASRVLVPSNDITRCDKCYRFKVNNKCSCTETFNSNKFTSPLSNSVSLNKNYLLKPTGNEFRIQIS